MLELMLRRDNIKNMTTDKTYPIKFDVLVHGGDEKLIEYLKTTYLSDFPDPPYTIDDKFFEDILKRAQSRSFKSATILDSGEIIWTKNA